MVEPVMMKDHTLARPPGAPAEDRSQERAAPEHAPVAIVKHKTGEPTKRDANGRLLPGHPGVPGCGRPKGLAARVREIVNFDDLVKMLVSIAVGPLAPAARIADRIKAAELLFDRGHGKPQQTVDVKGGEHMGIGASMRALPFDRLVATVEAMRALAAPIDTTAIEVDDTDDEPEPEPEVKEPEPQSHTFVGSSNIDSATLDTNGVLCVTFRNGGVYSYGGVTDAEFAAWVKAPSAGSHFAKEIKTKYPIVRS